MRHRLIEHVEKNYLKASPPEFRIGDTVDVHTRLVEGEKERIQIFHGTVIARRGSGINERFTVRRIVGEEGVERTFLVHSPNVVNVVVRRRGRVRRAKLFYLRHRVGKARKVRELRITKKQTGERELAGSTA
ncbi:MAG: 50S ribosomal protein L19 [Planctomycetota bacterium]|nr:MAG: 50S ribosomal protein L19 [Planctomycetota bacterium]